MNEAVFKEKVKKNPNPKWICRLRSQQLECDWGRKEIGYWQRNIDNSKEYNREKGSQRQPSVYKKARASGRWGYLSLWKTISDSVHCRQESSARIFTIAFLLWVYILIWGGGQKVD